MAKSFVSGGLKRNGRPMHEKPILSANDVQKYAQEIEDYLRRCGFSPNPGVVGKYATMDQMQKIKEEEEIDRMASAVSGAGLSSKGKKKPKQSSSASSRSRRKRKGTRTERTTTGMDEINK